MSDWIQRYHEGRRPSTEEGQKGGPGSGYHGHAGRPGEVGGSAVGTGGGAGSAPLGKPTWAGDEGQEVDGFRIHRGKFELTKNRYAVVTDDGQPSSWEDTPEKAVRAHQARQQGAAESRRQHEAYQGRIAKIRSGDWSEWNKITGGRNISSSKANSILRDLGLSDKDARKIISRMGIMGESSMGTVYRDPEELLQRYQNYRERQGA